jgi:hypothetical protein
MESITLVFFIPIELASCSETFYMNMHLCATFYMNFPSKSHITLLQNIEFINTAKSVEINLSIRSLHYSLAYSFIGRLFTKHSKKNTDGYTVY